LFSIVCWWDFWCCHPSSFEAFVGVWCGTRYGDPDRIMVGFKGCGTDNLGVYDTLGKGCHDVVAVAGHRLSACTGVVPCIGSVLSWFEQ